MRREPTWPHGPAHAVKILHELNPGTKGVLDLKGLGLMDNAGFGDPLHFGHCSPDLMSEIIVHK